MRILLVEDETRVAGFIAKGLREQSYAVDVAADGERASYFAAINQYDLVILDVMLPVKNGYAVCRELRAGGFRAPILMLTARDSVDDRVQGLDCGADDYLIKPFDFKELLARLRALSRRSGPPRPEVLRVADLQINTASHAVTRAGRPVNLTAKEYALLEYLAANPGRVFSRTMIIEHVWDQSFEGLTNIVDVYVRHLRSKVDEPFAVKLIRTVRGVGYGLSDGAEP